MAPLGVPERRRGRLGTAEDAQQIGVEHALPQLFGDQIELGGRDGPPHAGRAGVVDQEVEPAERADRPFDHRLAPAGLAHIAGRCDHLEAGCAELLHRLGPACVARQVVDRDLGAEAGQHRRRGETDAGGRAGDQRRLAIQIELHPVLL
jgi:hypothetical protein